MDATQRPPILVLTNRAAHGLSQGWVPYLSGPIGCVHPPRWALRQSHSKGKRDASQQNPSPHNDGRSNLTSDALTTLPSSLRVCNRRTVTNKARLRAPDRVPVTLDQRLKGSKLVGRSCHLRLQQGQLRRRCERLVDGTQPRGERCQRRLRTAEARKHATIRAIRSSVKRRAWR